MSSTKQKSKGISTQARKAVGQNSKGSRYKQAKSPEEYLTQRVFSSWDQDSCHLWVKGVDKNGYGQCQDSKWAKHFGVTRAHQLSYVTYIGEIPEGLVVCHTCDNPTCCNPNHLFLGTVADNNKDCRDKGRYKNGSKPNPNEAEVVKLWGQLPCEEVANLFGISFSRVCQIWRANGLKGRNFYKT